MPIIPPSGSSQVSGTSPGDPAGQVFYQTLLTLEDESAPFKELGTAILNNIPHGPPYDYSEFVTSMNFVFSKVYTDPSTGVTHDAYMEFKINPYLLNTMFIGALNTATGQAYAVPASLQFTDSDNLFFYVVAFVNQSTFPDMTEIASGFLQYSLEHLGSFGSEADFQLGFLKFLGDPNFFTAYPGLSMIDYQNVALFMSNQLSIPMTMFPDYLDLYFTVGCNWPPSQSAGDNNLQKGLLAAMGNIMAQGTGPDRPAILNMAQTIVNNGFTTDPMTGVDYSSCDITAAQALEQIFSISAPVLQPFLFQVRAWRLEEPSGSPVYSMIQDLEKGVISPSVWSGQTTLDAWYTNTYGTDDPFMKYYAVDQNDPTYADINKFYQLATGNAGTITPTGMDLKYRQAANYRDAPTTPASDKPLLNDLCSHWAAVGSNPTNDQLNQVAAWAATEVMGLNFRNASSATQQKFLNYFTDHYVVALSYMKLTLVEGMQPPAPSYYRQFATSMMSVMSAYSGQHPTPTRAGFQAYLNQYASQDFCTEFPGVAPSDIDTFLRTFSLQTPYQYQPIDTVFAKVYGALQVANLPAADAAYLKQLYQAVQNFQSNPAQYPLSTLLTNLLAASSTWGQYQPSTQQALGQIFTFDPLLSAYGSVYNALSKLPPGSVDAQVFSQFLGVMGQSANDPAAYPFSQSVVPALGSIFNSAQWASLQSSSQQCLSLIVISTPPFIG
jgi:hypothetical protein